VKGGVFNCYRSRILLPITRWANWRLRNTGGEQTTMIPEIEMMLAGLVFMLSLILCVLTRRGEGRWAKKLLVLSLIAVSLTGCGSLSSVNGPDGDRDNDDYGRPAGANDYDTSSASRHASSRATRARITSDERGSAGSDDRHNPGGRK
jgi:hypothetical protein